MVNTSSPSQLSPELESAECEIDNQHKENGLCRLPFSAAAWYLLAFGEDYVFKELMKTHRSTIQDSALFAEDCIWRMRDPLLWLRDSCMPGGGIPFNYDNVNYQDAWDLTRLGEDYRSFRIVFSYARRGFLNLETTGTTIIPHGDSEVDHIYEAYDRLVKEKGIALNNINNDVSELVRQSLSVTDTRFSYRLNPRIVSEAQLILSPILEGGFSLPNEWQLTNYSLGEFKRVAIALKTIAGLHLSARAYAASIGCLHLGYCDSVLVYNYQELLRRLTRYSGVTEEIVSHFIDDLTYGNREIRSPDPAIQPLIKLSIDQYAIVPSLLISSSMERNLVVLLNMLPSEKKVYARLTNEKEDLMRNRIKDEIALVPTRYFAGTIPGYNNLPDIDLAVISDVERACIIMELKWFIHPAEVREVIERSEEIQKGINQLLSISRAFKTASLPFYKALGIDDTYSLFYVVVSDNSIGHGKVQRPEIPVIQISHLLGKINSTNSLRLVIDWLDSRSYLPQEGIHFASVPTTSTVGRWSVKWYGIKPLTDAQFV